MRCLVAGAGGFIGGHLVKRLLDDGHEVVAVDIKHWEKWWQYHPESNEFGFEDLRLSYAHEKFVEFKADWVFNLACNMGGIGFIEGNKADCMESVLINTNLLRAAKQAKVQRYFYASSACVYHDHRQGSDKDPQLGFGLKEERDVYFNGGAMPEDGYGWEKLFSERMCRHAREDWGVDTRVARFHNIYGPYGSWNDDRTKAPAALCRKVAIAKKHGHAFIELWGDGTQKRSFCYVDDCIEGIIRLMQSDHTEPINIGSSELVTIDQLHQAVAFQSGWITLPNYDTTKPKGVDGRNSDNTKIKEVLGWEPTTSLKDGIAKLYPQIEEEVVKDDNL